MALTATASSYSLNLPGYSTPPVEEQNKCLEEALGAVKLQAFHMKRCLEFNKLMDAFKHASNMLTEFKTSSLTPKFYYELYMAIFDELRHLTSYLYDAHVSGRHHLSDLYELVQYAGSIVPRLYLMITVGSVYMKVSKEVLHKLPAPSNTKGSSSIAARLTFASDDNNATIPSHILDPSSSINNTSQPPPSSSSNPSEEATNVGNEETKPRLNVASSPYGKGTSDPDEDLPPIRELMNDMLEMCRGVQHPTRGLFLRYYLCVMTRDYLPDGLLEGPHGTIHDSIHFIIQNFIEMNKLWVRLQFQGHSRERAKRDQERRDLRLLLGSNLVRLSQLDELNISMYQTSILPKLLAEIVSCRDVIAQEYLMEVIIQIFPDDFHLRCLDMFLSATAQLQRNVNVKQIVISLIDRFANYASRAREEVRVSVASTSSSTPAPVPNGIPEDVELFTIFWTQITELIKTRPELTIHDVIALLHSLCNLALSCYPERIDYVDMVLGLAVQQVIASQTSASSTLKQSKTQSLLLQLLLGPIQTYVTAPLAFLRFPSSSSSQNPTTKDTTAASSNLGGHFTELLFLQPYSIRRQVAHAHAKSVLYAATHHELYIDSIEGVHLILGETCSIMVRDQVDGSLFGPKPTRKTAQFPHDPTQTTVLDETADDDDIIPLDWDDALEEQTLVAKMIHCIKADVSTFENEFELLSATRSHFGEGGDIRIRFTLPPLVTSSIFLARRYRSQFTSDLKRRFLEFIHETVRILHRAQEYFSDGEESNPLFKEDYYKYSGTGRDSAMASFQKSQNHSLMAPPDISLRLYLLGAQLSNELGDEEMCYEFFVQALTVYEDAVSDSKAQFSAMTLLIGTLYGVSVFGYENYETLITKCTVHCSRLLKRVDQCRGVTLASHLFWPDEGLPRQEDKKAHWDGKRVLECLQKALKIADSVMDRGISVGLFVEILERYIWYYENRNDVVTLKYINSLIDLIQTNLSSFTSSDGTDRSSTAAAYGMGGVTRVPSGPLSIPSLNNFFVTSNSTTTTGLPSSPYGNRYRTMGSAPGNVNDVLSHYKNVLGYLRRKRDQESEDRDTERLLRRTQQEQEQQRRESTLAFPSEFGNDVAGGFSDQEPNVDVVLPRDEHGQWDGLILPPVTLPSY